MKRVLQAGCAATVLLVAGLSAQLARSDEMVSVAPVAPELRRLSEAQYRQSIADIFGDDINLVGRFEPDLRVSGLLALGGGKVSMSLPALEQYEAIAREISKQVVDVDHRDRLIGCAPGAGDKNGRKCAEAFFSRVGLRLYRRPLTKDELRQAVTASEASAKALGSFHAGVAAQLAAMLSGPEFLFRVDNAVADRSSPGGWRLDGWSRATRISFFLWNTTPDDVLLGAAARGELDDPAGVARHVDRMIASPRFIGGVRAFFDDMLRLDGFETLSKDSLLFPEYVPAISREAREQTLRTITDHVVTERRDYRDLFTTKRFAMNRALGPLYRVPVPNEGWQMIDLPQSDARAGLLTQIGFLALHSHPGRTSPTLRGKAVRELLMCEHIPSPPADVDFTVVQDTTNPRFKTTRERVNAHLTVEQCAGCHRLTDPIGLSLEKFDGAGQYRSAENGAAIDVSGAFAGQAFTDAATLGAVIRDRPKVSACLVESMWRYAAGYEAPAPVEKPLFSNLQSAFATSGYRIPDLMKTIVLTPQFLSASPPRSGREPKERHDA